MSSIKWNLQINSFFRNGFLFIILLFINLLSKGLFLLNSELFLDSDQAITLLMSRRILEMKEFPFFFWGQNYMGMAEVWFSLPFQFFLGKTIESFIFSQIFLFTLITYYLFLIFYKEGKKTFAYLVSLFFSIGHPFLNSHITNVSENFTFSIFCGLSGFYFIEKFNLEEKKISPYIFFFGILSGFSFYNREILFLILPWVFVIWFKNYKLFFQKLPILFLGILIGYIPAILHYLTNPYYKKLINPKIVWNINFENSYQFLKNSFWNPILTSGEIGYSISLLLFSFLGICFFIKEKDNLLKKQINYFFLGTFSSFIVILLSSGYNTERYYFFQTIFSIFFSAYFFYSILGFLQGKFRVGKFLEIILISFFCFISIYNLFYQWQSRFNLLEKKNPLKNIAEYLKENSNYFGISEYWVAYPTAYFSEDQIHNLIYLDKQSDLYSVKKVLENRAGFFLFKKNSNFEKHFIQNRNSKNSFKQMEFDEFILYIPEKPTLDFLEPHRDLLLKEIYFQKK